MTIPKALAIPPRDNGLRPADDDQIRLSLLGIQQCQGCADDTERFTRLLRWFAKKELEYEPGSPEERLQVAAAEAASYLGVENDHPVMRRIRAMFELDRLGVSISGSDQDGWRFHINSDIWRFRDVQSLADCEQIRQEWIEETAPEWTERQADAVTPEAGTTITAFADASTMPYASYKPSAALAIITHLLRRFPAVVRELESK